MDKALRSLVTGLIYPAVLATFLIEIPRLFMGDAEGVVKWVLGGLVLRYIVGYLYLVGTVDAQWSNKGYSHRCAVLDLGVVVCLYFAVQMLRVSTPVPEQSVPALVLNDIWYFLIAARFLMHDRIPQGQYVGVWRLGANGLGGDQDVAAVLAEIESAAAGGLADVVG